MSDVPIRDHAFLSDCRTSALVTKNGSVDWMCSPRFDSPSVLGRLLDSEAGHFAIRPVDASAQARWAYRSATLVLDTVWTSASGTVVVTDALALGAHEHGHDLGRTSPGVLLRRVECIDGVVDVRVEFSPRPEFGLVRPRLRAVSGGILAEGGAHTWTLGSSQELTLDGPDATADLCLIAGDEVTFALEVRDAWEPAARPWSRRAVRRRIQRTQSSWESWSQLHQHYDGPWRDRVLFSGVVLRGLTYARSGAMVAAATTSLPEGVGSGRTWDYRYTWVRDASMTMQGLFVAACPDEAAEFFDFLARAAASDLDEGLHLPVMFGVGGERDLSERELAHLDGWRGSGPVRVGNDAWTQRQLDVYGAVLDAALTLREQLEGLDPHTRSFLVSAVETAAAKWTEPDRGIWEVRGEARQFLHSTLMCWVALDRGVQLADLLDIDEVQCERWASTRDGIRAAIEARGWNADVGAFTQTLDGIDLDAASLLTVLTGFLPPNDPRLLSTIDAVESGLSDERGLVRRYRADDGLQTSEGAFLLCTFWLAQALAVSGQVERARTVMDRAVACATELGLLAEEVDGESGELLGNVPQAFSHLGLVNAAWAIHQASEPALP